MDNFYKDNPDLAFQFGHPLMHHIVGLKEADVADALENYDLVLEIVGDISANTIAPSAEEADHEGPALHNGRVSYARATAENHRILTQAGLYGMALPHEYNGLNFPMVPYVMAAEIVARADAGFSNIWGLQDCAETIREFGSEELKQEFLPRISRGATCSMDLTEPDAGSDLQAVMLKATWDESTGFWLLNGVKRFITNGDAQIQLILARSEEGSADGRGLSYFVHDQAWGGVRVRRIENKLGIKSSPTCELTFSNAPAKLIGERKLGLIKYTMSLMNGARLGVGAQSVGISEAAYREALKFAQERKQFGKPVLYFPAVAEMLDTIKAKLQASRALLYETARFTDMYKLTHLKQYQRLIDCYTPLLKFMAGEYANQNAYDGLQVHGGSGFMKDYPIERLFRDARITTIYEGTSQLQVVAAVKGVINGIFLSQIKEYQNNPVQSEYEPLKQLLLQMTDEYEQTLSLMQGIESDCLDFHARRLVEMAGHIIMGYLLLIDAQRDESFAYSAEFYIFNAQSQNRERACFIHSCLTTKPNFTKSKPLSLT
ncbi:MAG: acyl-CoA dehydrogenase family protein [Bacteroidetes bacterium]|nr:acyl-CoA dehydrogenase family protein [Bacteroidota bacterium]